ncbi:MAG: response regulator [Caldimonas sp.]
MKAPVASTRVLVASDSIANAAQIVRHLRDDFAETRAATAAATVAEDFEQFAPDLLILAFDSLQKAQGYALELYRHSQRAGHHGHRSILLCHKDELREAFELCRKGSFDDYVLYWPLAQDGYRLTMSVWNAARQVVAAPALGPSNLELIAHARQLGAMRALVEQQMSEGERRAASADSSLEQAERSIGSAIDDLARRLADREAAVIVDVKDPGGLAREFERLKNDPVAQAFEATATAQAPARSWSRQLNEKLQPHLNGLREIGEKIGKVTPVVLVVEDDEFARQLMHSTLEGTGYEVLFAADGVSALGLLRRIRPDLILMDVNLPDTDGVALTQKLKSLPHLADIPILMLTGEARRETLESSMNAGAAGFIVKPFTRDALVAKLERFLWTVAQ